MNKYPRNIPANPQLHNNQRSRPRSQSASRSPIKPVASPQSSTQTVNKSGSHTPSHKIAGESRSLSTPRNIHRTTPTPDLPAPNSLYKNHVNPPLIPKSMKSTVATSASPASLSKSGRSSSSVVQQPLSSPQTILNQATNLNHPSISPSSRNKPVVKSESGSTENPSNQTSQTSSKKRRKKKLRHGQWIYRDADGDYPPLQAETLGNTWSHPTKRNGSESMMNTTNMNEATRTPKAKTATPTEILSVLPPTPISQPPKGEAGTPLGSTTHTLQSQATSLLSSPLSSPQIAHLPPAERIPALAARLQVRRTRVQASQRRLREEMGAFAALLRELQKAQEEAAIQASRTPSAESPLAKLVSERDALKEAKRRRKRESADNLAAIQQKESTVLAKKEEYEKVNREFNAQYQQYMVCNRDIPHSFSHSIFIPLGNARSPPAIGTSD